MKTAGRLPIVRLAEHGRGRYLFIDWEWLFQEEAEAHHTAQTTRLKTAGSKTIRQGHAGFCQIGEPPKWLVSFWVPFYISPQKTRFHPILRQAQVRTEKTAMAQRQLPLAPPAGAAPEPRGGPGRGVRGRAGTAAAAGVACGPGGRWEVPVCAGGVGE